MEKMHLTYMSFMKSLVRPCVSAFSKIMLKSPIKYNIMFFLFALYIIFGISLYLCILEYYYVETCE